jgi:ABC-type sulfate transport system substrate-binding protein
VPTANPAGIRTPADLAKRGVKVTGTAPASGTACWGSPRPPEAPF